MSSPYQFAPYGYVRAAWESPRRTPLRPVAWSHPDDAMGRFLTQLGYASGRPSSGSTREGGEPSEHGESKTSDT